MKKIFKLLPVFAAISVLMSVMAPAVFAAATQGKITGDAVRMRDKATTSGSTIICELSKGTIVTLNAKTDGQFPAAVRYGIKLPITVKPVMFTVNMFRRSPLRQPRQKPKPLPFPISVNSFRAFRKAIKAP